MYLHHELMKAVLLQHLVLHMLPGCIRMYLLWESRWLWYILHTVGSSSWWSCHSDETHWNRATVWVEVTRASVQESQYTQIELAVNSCVYSTFSLLGSGPDYVLMPAFIHLFLVSIIDLIADLIIVVEGVTVDCSGAVHRRTFITGWKVFCWKMQDICSQKRAMKDWSGHHFLSHLFIELLCIINGFVFLWKHRTPLYYFIVIYVFIDTMLFGLL